jgi:C_GCAxxG_C_C family probable redox protein
MLASFSREEIMISLDKKVKKSISISGNCAQSAFLALQEQFELEDGAILKALTPFPGGIALRGDTCGVVIGCVLALGLVFGKEKMDDITGVFESLPKVREFCRQFESEMGGITCREIAKSDFKKWYNREEFCRQFESEMGGITCREIAKSDFKKWYNREDPNESWKGRNVSAIKHRTAVTQTGVRIAADIILKSR